MLSQLDFAYVQELLLRHAGIALNADQAYLAESRLDGLARAVQAKNVQELISRLRGRAFGAHHVQLIESMTTNETSFFRDEHTFVHLRYQLLPELLQSRAASRTLTIWSAACSSGQEPYSIAILLREYFSQLEDWSIRIIASDLSSTMLARARDGHYTRAELARGMPQALSIKYFEPHHDQFRVKEPLREMISWQRLNLIEPWLGLPRFDVVFMRNVLIYFTRETRAKLLARARRQLADDGCLVLGSTESSYGLSDEFSLIESAGASIYRANTERDRVRPRAHSRSNRT